MAEQPYKFCPYCGDSLPKDSTSGKRIRDCPSCEFKISNPASRRLEYKSKLSLFGWPLIHVLMGQDRQTRTEVARGLIAIGDIAVGGVALGGVAIGGLAFGGLAVGLISIAGCSIGLLFAIGGLAISGGLGMGGGAIGAIAVGGGAVGYYAFGGGTFAVHGFGGNIRDPIAREFFFGWRLQLKELVTNVGPMVASGILVPLIVLPFLRSNAEPEMLDGKRLVKENTVKPSLMGLMICIFLGGAFGLGLLWMVAMGITFTV